METVAVTNTDYLRMLALRARKSDYAQITKTLRFQEFGVWLVNKKAAGC